jgi:hypothetical protein
LLEKTIEPNPDLSAANVCVYESESERRERERGAPERFGLGSIVFSGKIWAILRLR